MKKKNAWKIPPKTHTWHRWSLSHSTFPFASIQTSWIPQIHSWDSSFCNLFHQIKFCVQLGSTNFFGGSAALWNVSVYESMWSKLKIPNTCKFIPEEHTLCGDFTRLCFYGSHSLLDLFTIRFILHQLLCFGLRSILYFCSSILKFVLL